MKLKKPITWRRLFAVILFGVLAAIAYGIPTGLANTRQVVGRSSTVENASISFDGTTYVIQRNYENSLRPTPIRWEAQLVSRGHPLVVDEMSEIRHSSLDWMDPVSRPPSESEITSALLEYVSSNSTLAFIDDLAVPGVTTIRTHDEMAFYIDCLLGGARLAIDWVIGAGVLMLIVVLIPSTPEPWQCRKCRYDLRGLDGDGDGSGDGAVCPECGLPKGEG